MLYTVNFDKENKLYYRRADTALSRGSQVVEIGYNTVPPKTKQFFKRDTYIIHYVTNGSGLFMGEPFSSGHCYFVAAGEYETIESTIETYESSWIMLKGEHVKEILRQCGFSEHNSVFRFEYTDECSRIIRKYLFEEAYDHELEEACKLEKVLYSLLSFHIKKLSVQNTQKKAPVRIQAIADYIENNYQNDIKINDLCRVFFFSKNHLCTIFKSKYGMTPKEYLIHCRLSQAKTLLKDKNCNMSITEIALAVGISNPLYFSRFFHQNTGVSPTDYRNGIRSKNK